MRCVVCCFSLPFVFMLLSSKTTTRADIMKLEVGAFDRKFNHPFPYYAEISLGTPPQPVILVLDMTTDLVWFVCGVNKSQTMPPVPGSNDSIPSDNPISKPYSSPYAYNLNSTTTYSYIFSNTPLCPTTFNHDVNSKILCAKHLVGLSGAKATSERVFLSIDRLITNNRDYADFIFSCAAYDSNISYTYKAAGVLGLGREELSLVSQLGLTFNNSFSYCLPPLLQDSTGYLALIGYGNVSSSSQPITHTPLIPDPQLYLIGMTSITINGTKVSIDSSESNTALNPGTLFTTLPRAAYNKMREVFQAMNINVDPAGDFPPLDLCFNTSDPPNIPKVEINFGDAVVELHDSAIMYGVMNSTTKTCLAFQGRSDDAPYNTLGGLQQAQMDVLFDLAQNIVGFRNDDCGSG